MERKRHPGTMLQLAQSFRISLMLNEGYGLIASSKQPQLPSRPLQARHDRAAHHLILVALAQEGQLFRELRDALAVACLGVGVGEVSAPIAALRPVGVE